MKIFPVSIRVFEKGDYVRTPAGVAKVVSSELIYNRGDLTFRRHDVIVKHKFGSSSNPSNERQDLDADNLIPIDLKKYREEKE